MEKNETNQSAGLIANLEAMRQRNRKLYVTLAAICIPILIAGLIAGFLLRGADGALAGLVICAVVDICIVLVVVHQKKTNFVTEFKRIIVTEELQKVFQNVEYKWNSHIGEELVKSLNIFQSFDEMSGDDYVSANFKGAKFFRSDFSLYVEEEKKETSKNSSGNTVTETIKEKVQVFSGSITCIEREKPYPAWLLFFTKGFQHIRGIKGRFFGRESNELVTESIDFNRDYEVACDDQIGGRIILSSRRMQGLRRLDEMIPDRFALLFEGNKLYLIVRSDNCFEPKVFGKTSVLEQQREMAEQVAHLRERLDLLLELEE